MAAPSDRGFDEEEVGRRGAGRDADRLGAGDAEAVASPEGDAADLRFAFDQDGALLLKTVQKPLGEALPERKFWVFSAGADHDDAPYGLGLGHWLYWPVWFKRNGHRFWAVYLEKFGTPAAKGTYPTNATEAQQNTLLEALRALRQDSAVVVPEGMVVELIEATRSGTADYAAFVEAMNKAILVAAIGQTATTSGTPGKLGSDQEQGDVRMDIVKADADLLSASFNGSVARWLTEWNFPGAAVPGVWRVIEEAEDLKTRSDRDRNIYTMGYRPTLKYVSETYGGEWEEKPAAPPPQTGIATEPGESFAEGEEALDALTNRMARESGQTVAAWLETIRAMLETAGSLEEALAMLDTAYGRLSTSALTTVMRDGFAAAELAGMAEVQDGR